MKAPGLRIGTLSLVIASIAMATPRAVAQEDAAVSRPRCWHLGESIEVGAGDVLDCSLVVIGGDVTVQADGAIAGDLAVPFGSAFVDGTVQGNAFASGRLHLGETARIQGDASSLGDMVVAAGAHVAGRTDRLNGQARAGDALGPDVQAAAGAVGFLAILAVLAAITAALATVVAAEPIARARGASFGSLQRALGSLALGTVAGILALVIIVVTLLTIFLPMVIAALTLCALVVGAAALAERTGTPLLPRAGRKARAAAGACVLVLLVFGPLLFRPPLAVFAALLILDLLLVAAALGGGLVGLWLAWRDGRLDREARAGDKAAWPATAEETPGGAADDGWDAPRPSLMPAGETAPERVIPETVLAADDDLSARPEAAKEPRARPSSLRDLPGMTPIYAQLLASAGVQTIDALAAADATAIVRMMVVPGVRGIDVATAEAWVRAARDGGAGGA